MMAMPRPTPIAKVSPTEGHGETVILEGEKFEDAYAHAVEVGKTRGLTFVHPFDDADIIAGQGTIALEMLETAPEIDTLVVPIGGGGLIDRQSVVQGQSVSVRVYLGGRRIIKSKITRTHR